MKFDNHNNKSKPDIEISIEKKQYKEKFIFAGVLKPKPNQRVFQLELSNMTVSECEYFTKTDTIRYLDVINGTQSLTERDILIKEGFDYIIKLNISNAIKYFINKWNDDSIVESDESKAQTLFKKQRKVNKYTN